LTWVFRSAVHKHLARINSNQPLSGIEGKTRLRNGLYPFLDPETIPNCKRYIVIERDGSSVESIYLNINQKSDREKIIVHHLLAEAVRTIGQEKLGFNLIGRDDPWDFTFEFSSGVTRHFEIVSVSDGKDFFRRLSREEFLQDAVLEEMINESKLKKALRDFPELSDVFVSKNYAGADAGDRLVPNPLYGLGEPVFVNDEPVFPTDTPEEKILEAINSKARKKHGGKNETVLIIDNRFICADLQLLLEKLTPCEEEIASSPFEEVWLYTGYGGYYFGQDGEYALFPLKLHPSLLDTYLSAEINLMPWGNY
jgi:hypothetical protein